MKAWGVRKDIAKNPNTPPIGLKVLANDESLDVSQFALSNPNFPPYLKFKLAITTDNAIL
jgi:hypothetical protein